MQKRKVLLVLTFLVSLCSFWATQAEDLYAGIYNADTDVIYKEYWLPHSQFTGGYVNHDSNLCQNSSGGGDWYLEPWPSSATCRKTVTLNIPDDLTKATKVELYLDLWRNHNHQVARFTINDHGTIYAPPVGSDWSRTPYVVEIPKSELKQGNNTFKFWDGGGGYHIHDMAVRLYFAEGDITAPDGNLLTVGGVAANAGGQLNVDSDQLQLVAETTTNAKFIEFHAYYEGYDEDTDGVTRDWHNRARNNWQVGGTEAKPTGGTIDHIKTILAPSSGVYTATWDLSHIVNQSGVKFKIRIVDNSGSVREAAGGVSADFTLKRSRRMAAFWNPNFQDAVLHHSNDGVAQYPDLITRTVDLPASLAGYTTGYVLGAYWSNPRLALNGNTAFLAHPVGVEDTWTLSVRNRSISEFRTGTNNIVYTYTGGFGQFIEKPGALIVLKQGATMTDNTPPLLANQIPAPGAVAVAPTDPMVLHITDAGLGVDRTTITLRVNGNEVTPQISGFSNDYTLRYVAPGGLPEESVVTVAVDMCDLAGICTTNQQYTFNTTGIDVAPPVIMNPTCIVGTNRATIAWDTDEPSTGLVNYGPSAAYGSEASGNQLSIHHEIQLVDLTDGSPIHYQIMATDSSDNSAQTVDAVCPELEDSSLVSDDFNVCALDTERWIYIDPQAGTAGASTMELVDNQIVFTVPGGIAHDVWTSGIDAPHLMQATTNTDFTIEVKFDSSLGEGYQLQGILIQQDSNNFVRINFQSNENDTSSLLGFTFTNGTPEAVSYKALASGDGPMYLRLVRLGTQWQIFYSNNGSDWVASGSFTYALEVSAVGLFAGNAGVSPAHTAVVDYFFNDAARISPEDGKALYLGGLDVSPAGAGVAQSAPVTTTVGAPATCGTPIRLTATPSIGWSFDQWVSAKGSVAGNSNPLVTDFTFDEVVTATFTQNQYALDKNVVGNGTIDATPLQTTYLYSDVVTLTATPALGWSFIDWQGASTSDSPSTSLTITADTAITATFVANQYTLAVNSSGDGSGSTTVSPLQASYLYSDVVTLSAQATPGSTFIGWSGAVTSSQLTETLTITENSVVTATFAEEAYTLDLDVVTNNVNANNSEAGGTVAATPSKNFYGFNEQVNLVATAKPGWLFSGWSGGATGSDASISVIITENTAITATFTQQQYTLTRATAGPGTGTITVSPDQATYLFGEVVTVEAVAATGSLFDGWSGAISGTAPTMTLTITEDTNILATFAQKEYQVAVTVLGGQGSEIGGTVAISPEGPYFFNSKVTLTATPSEGYHFSHWSADPTQLAETNSTLEITVTEDVLYFANFEKDEVIVIEEDAKIFLPLISR